MTKLNRSNADKTKAPAGHTGSATCHAERPRHEVGVALRGSAEPRGNTDGGDTSRTERLNAQGKNTPGGDNHAAGDGNERPVSEGEKGGPPARADTPGREPSDAEGPPELLDKRSHAEHGVDTAHGDQLCAR